MVTQRQTVLIRGVPKKLWAKLKAKAALKGTTLRDLVLWILAKEMGSE